MCLPFVVWDGPWPTKTLPWMGSFAPLLYMHLMDARLGIWCGDRNSNPVFSCGIYERYMEAIKLKVIITALRHIRHNAILYYFRIRLAFIQ